MWNSLLEKIQSGDQRALARAISLVENEMPGSDEFLQELPHDPAMKIIGITGPPGAGKSALTDLLIGQFTGRGERVAVICIDPSSPFSSGALLGDRIRMRQWYNHSWVFIRSMSARGSLGGLNSSIIEVADLVRAAGFRHLIIETVGVGQNEVEIAALADTTVVVQVPESGDDIQTLKSGLMDIADVFVVNKCDRPGSDLFIRTLHESGRHIPVVKTIATEKQGIADLEGAINVHEQMFNDPEKKFPLLADRAFQLIVKKKASRIDRGNLEQYIRDAYAKKEFNLFKIVAGFAGAD